jgi:hypothetical protein
MPKVTNFTVNEMMDLVVKQVPSQIIRHMIVTVVVRNLSDQLAASSHTIMVMIRAANKLEKIIEVEMSDIMTNNTSKNHPHSKVLCIAFVIFEKLVACITGNILFILSIQVLMYQSILYSETLYITEVWCCVVKSLIDYRLIAD